MSKDRKTLAIRTDYWRKPGPSDKFDWVAVFDDYEPGKPVGYGATEKEARLDLLSYLERCTV